MPAVGKQVLVIGSGGREHAICWKLSQSPLVSKIFALPGSFGIDSLDICQNLDGVDAKDFKAIAKWCKDNKIDLVIVGPEDPLALGLGDVLQSAGIPCFGPGKKGAQIEADKKWAKDFMLRHNIPTARYESFTDCVKAKEFIKKAPYKALVVKAAGLAAGKGVVVAANAQEACQAVDDILGDKKYGSAGETLVIEELLTGEEVSVLAFVDNNVVQPMLPAQDHKRLKEKDQGPNTGGMGAYCPCPLISEKDLEMVKRDVLQKAVDGLRAEGIDYKGVLYAGMMLTPDGPRVLEFNCRFGDPETQVILPMLDCDLYEVMAACCTNQLKNVTLKWKKGVSAVGVVMASAGYPETSTKGCVIEGIPPSTSDQIVFHSGVGVNAEGKFVTNGGRVLIAVTLRKDLKQAAQDSTKICQHIKFSGAGAQYRTDIAEKAFKYQRGGPQPSLSYKDSGVDIDAGDDFVQRIKPLSRGTQRPGVLGGLGGFGGLFRLNELNYQNPVICEATNGVGSKIQLALSLGTYENLGYDLFAMCANDILETGAEPIAFLDYIACGKLQVPLAAQIVKGISEGCRDAKCALVGGETAEMPSVYEVGKYDVAGYCVGVVEKGMELPRYEQYEEGDLLISLPSSGLHCGGFNAILSSLQNCGINLSQKCEFGDTSKSLGENLATASRVYAMDVLPLIRTKEVKAVAHITGGLIPGVSRILPSKYETALDFGDLKVPEVYAWLGSKLRLSPDTILQSLNCGIGLVMIVPKTSTSWKTIKGSKVLGVIKRRISNHPQRTQIEVKNFIEALEKHKSKYGSVGDGELSEPNHHELQDSLIVSAESREESFVTQNGRRVTEVPGTFKDPILIMGTDGVGTKIKIAQETGRNSTVGIDLVAMCVNDILCNGAEPFTFASYYACGQLDEEMAEEIVDGVIEGSRQAGASLVESHIAEVPILYKPKVYDLAGFSLGIAEHDRILPLTDQIQPGDVLIGLPSSGVHSNGFSLVHAVMKLAGVSFEDKTPFSNLTFGEELLRPTRIYVKALIPLIEQGLVKAMAHITGGGLTENIPRVLRKDLAVQLNADNFNIPPIFAWLAKEGNVKPEEMKRTYNCGLGMVLVVDPKNEKKVMELIQYTERASKVGVVKRRDSPKSPQVIVDNFEKCLDRTKKVIYEPRKRVAVLISGSGTNLQALIEATKDTSQGLHSDIVLVISNKPGVKGVDRAKDAGIPCIIVNHKDYQTREDFDAEMSKHLQEMKVDIICLAGFMRVLSDSFVKQWKGKLLNIHPSLLPKHPGLNVQRKAIEAGDQESGCTVHYVDEGVDTGAIVVQSAVPVLAGDTEETLTHRIHYAEYYSFPKALRMVATGLAYLNKDGKTVYV
ncbi:trifunctional purine biosynthetic protein adenosine-3 Gart [Haematobia irritans]|uniref:trifunctional purine biosynthetic protein adenosine-3 Gart n=1 Tax=Haematobia irritans TaxID=7368 RepID=UPI003F501284